MMQVKHWVEDPERLEYLRSVFSTTTRYGSLQNVAATVAGRNVYLRFKCSTGSAMGMNMVGKGTLAALHAQQTACGRCELTSTLPCGG
jgi:hydroxymethylglutaryl-CoA reductase (NADPH)